MLTRSGAPSHEDPSAPSHEAPSPDARLDSLVARCRLGDRDGFGELVALTEPTIRRLLGRLACRGADLDDLVQETYLRAWRSLPGFRGESRFSTWLVRIATNAASTWRQGRRIIATLPDDAGGSLRSPPGLGEVPLMEAYERALSGLSPELRAVFVLHEAEGLSYRDVAEALDCPIGTVMSRLHRARVKILDGLRERLEELAP
jgi:RNA polymerase sigma-70 factor (ECF subfamily)